MSGELSKKLIALDDWDKEPCLERDDGKSTKTLQRWDQPELSLKCVFSKEKELLDSNIIPLENMHIQNTQSTQSTSHLREAEESEKATLETTSPDSSKAATPSQSIAGSQQSSRELDLLPKKTSLREEKKKDIPSSSSISYSSLFSSVRLDNTYRPSQSTKPRPKTKSAITADIFGSDSEDESPTSIFHYSFSTTNSDASSENSEPNINGQATPYSTIPIKRKGKERDDGQGSVRKYLAHEHKYRHQNQHDIGIGIGQVASIDITSCFEPQKPDWSIAQNSSGSIPLLSPISSSHSIRTLIPVELETKPTTGFSAGRNIDEFLFARGNPPKKIGKRT
ncbi:hypothetical protein PHYBLDRAFT_143709 [Phycomyces blakesleeanus NRRL 1555(-)]|nr:hypothetical protein PHYBLDRAFT_143709 [Phycomyces blakesleeanus NRRL 1555(-)]OAD75468.1 hypothetical protein PHYBLDRAFT_143709 [Phycomyces blakesleeanus NRRL 1555(-)]|eukprot:XP_018293508.1 hypothetical protein PHYBLDRAFT_143709 [Phycomyces blakesleeanus NRRL 1555(-)]